MRPQSKVLDQLVGWASGTDTIRAMWLTGSRADPARTPDVLSDYDIGMHIRAVRPFIDNGAWINRFGSPIVRWPESPSPMFSDDWITQLVQYQDGLRIDFQMTQQQPDLETILAAGYRVLIDKDGLFTAVPREHGPRTGITPPDENAFRSRVNAFWWDIVYLPKALCRGELNFAKYMLDDCIRFGQLQPLIEWYIGLTSGWAADCGLHGRWFQQLLPKRLWTDYLGTFAGPGIEENWAAVWATMKFVRKIATEIAAKLAFEYPQKTDSEVTKYVEELHRRCWSGSR